jgi:hypothetical protein
MRQIASISYYTNRRTSDIIDDWYLQICTATTGSGDFSGTCHDRLNGNTPTAYLDPSLSAPAMNAWNLWHTNDTDPSSADNSIKFSINKHGTVTFADIIKDPRYSGETISYFSLQTNSTPTQPFTSYLDGLTVSLTDGRSASVNFEATPTATPEPATFTLIGLPLLAVAGLRLRRRG